MVKVKKGFLKKTGCILISASIILTGVTFFGSSVSEADLDEDIQNEEVIEQPAEEPAVDVPATEDGQDTVVVGEPVVGETPTVEEPTEETNPEVTTPTDEVTTPEVTDPAIPTETVTPTEETPEPATEETTTLELNPEELALAEQQVLMAPMMLLASQNSTDTSEEATYEGSTLVYVPKGASSDDHSFTLRSGTTAIAAGAFDDSDVVYLVIPDATSLTSISRSQGPWTERTLFITCPNDEFDADLEIVKFVNDINTSGAITLAFGDDDPSGGETTYYTITFDYQLIDSEGTIVTTIKGAKTQTVEEGTTPSANADSSYTFGGTVYTRVTASDPSLSPATTDAKYTYTFQSSSVVKNYTITIDYQLNSSSGSKVTDVTAETQTIAEGVTPTHNAPASYDKDGTTYYLTTSPTFVAATADATYTYVYTASSGETVYTIQYQLLNGSGDVVVTQAITTTTDPSSYTPISNYTYGNVTYALKSATPSISGTVYTYIYQDPNSGGGGSGGGGSGGGGSSGGSSGGGSSSGSGSAKPVSDAAKSNFIYQIIEGAGQVVGQSDGAVRIVCNGPVEKLAYIMMDGNIVPRENYTIASGSTIMTLNKDYVANMALGDHAVQFQYTDGYAMTGLRIVSGATKTTTTVTYKVSSDGSISAGHVKDTTPKTADGFDTRYLLCLAIFLLGAGAILMSKEKRLEAILAGAYDEE